MTRQNAILTYTNTLFYPLNPQMDEVKIEDIAVINIEACSRNARSRAGSNLCTVIKDNREVVIGELSDTIHPSTGGGLMLKKVWEFLTKG